MSKLLLFHWLNIQLIGCCRIQYMLYGANVNAVFEETV